MDGWIRIKPDRRPVNEHWTCKKAAYLYKEPKPKAKIQGGIFPRDFCNGRGEDGKPLYIFGRRTHRDKGVNDDDEDNEDKDDDKDDDDHNKHDEHDEHDKNGDDENDNDDNDDNDDKKNTMPVDY